MVDGGYPIDHRSLSDSGEWRRDPASQSGRQEIIELAAEIRKQSEKASRWWIGPLTSLLIIIMGIGINWGTTIMTVRYLEERVGKLELKQAELVVSQVYDDAAIKTIEKDLGEIKKDVKKLVRRKKFSQ